MKNESMTFEELKKDVLTLRDKYTERLEKERWNRGRVESRISLSAKIEALNEVLIMIEKESINAIAGGDENV